MNRRILFWLPLATILSFINSYYGVPYLPVLYIVIWFCVWGFFGLKSAVLFYLLIMLIEGDISKYGPLEESNYITIYTTYIFGKSVSLIWTVLNFLVLIAQYYKVKSFKVNKYILPFLLMFVVSVILSITNDRFSTRVFISDFGYFINFFSGYIACNVFLKNQDDVVSFFKACVIILITKVLIISLDSILMSLLGFFNTYAVESSAYLLPVALSYMFLMFGSHRILSTISFLGMFMFFMVSASRGRMLVASLALLVAAYSAGKKRAVLLLFSSIPVVFILVAMWNPDTANYFMWKLTTFIPSAADANGKVESMSSMVRYIELLNIVGLHLDKVYTLFLGTGLGGYFTVDYFPFPFNVYGTSSYPDEWIANNTYYKPHGSLLFTLLKFGLLGYVCIFGTVIMLSKTSINLLKNKKTLSTYDNLILSISSFLPFLFIVNFTSKLQVFSGVLFAILSTISSSKLKDEKNHTN